MGLKKEIKYFKKTLDFFLLYCDNIKALEERVMDH